MPDLNVSLLIEASAGAGKTYALAKRYVSLVLNSPDCSRGPSKILAVTFTNKAAEEMRRRILLFLKKIAFFDIDPQRDRSLLEILNSAGAVKKKAFEVLEYILNNYSHFHVHTIDSFINTLISGCAYEIGLPADFNIRHYYKPQLKYSLDTVVFRAWEDERLKKTFSRFIERYLFLERKSSWFPLKDILAAMAEMFYLKNTYGMSFGKSRAEEKDIALLHRNVLKKMKEFYADISSKNLNVNARFLSGLRSVIEESRCGYLAIKEFAKKKSLAGGVIPWNKGEKGSKVLERKWAEILEDTGFICEAECFGVFDPYIDIFAEVFKTFQDKNKQDNIVFLAELNRYASKVFSRGLPVAELYWRLSLQFSHYLIDEFQDTSTLQWKNLLAMLEEALSRGGSVFCVGDKKQAIYGFRGGDVSLFKKIEETALEKAVLKKNYRSHRAIVEFNNGIFSEKNIKRFIREYNQNMRGKENSRPWVIIDEAAAENIVSFYKNSLQEFNEEKSLGYVYWEKVEEADSKKETREVIREKVVPLVKELLGRFSAREIALLLRSNGEVEEVTKWLLAEDISVVSEKTLNVKENPLIKETVSLLKFLSSPIDNLSFASFITGKIFLGHSGLKKEDIEEFIIKNPEGDYLYIRFREKFSDIWQECFEEFFKKTGFLPLYELVRAVFNKFEVFARFAEAQGFFMKFLDLVKEKEKDYFDLGLFLEFFDTALPEELYMTSSEADAVQVLTIHKAKGLEFGVVILPFLEMSVRLQPANLGEKTRFQAVRYQDKVFIVSLYSHLARFSPAVAEFFKIRFQGEFLNNLNTAYVGLTRAEKEMYIFIPKKSGRYNNIAWYLFPAEKGQAGRKHSYPAAGEETAGVLDISASPGKDWFLSLQDKKESFFSSSRRQRLKLGTVLHKALSYVGDLSKIPLKECLAGFFAGNPVGKEEQEFIQDRLEKITSSPEIKRFFFLEKGAEVFTEKEFVDSRGNTRRMDRVIAKADFVWVIDYKLDRKEDFSRDRQQVNDYKEILKDIFPGRAIRGFLAFLEEEAVEET